MVEQTSREYLRILAYTDESRYILQALIFLSPLAYSFHIFLFQDSEKACNLCSGVKYFI